MKYQKNTQRNDPENLENLLIIFDNLICNSELNKAGVQLSSITKLYNSTRQYNISVIFCSQSHTLLPKPLRKMLIYSFNFQ